MTVFNAPNGLNNITIFATEKPNKANKSIFSDEKPKEKSCYADDCSAHCHKKSHNHKICVINGDQVKDFVDRLRYKDYLKNFVTIQLSWFWYVHLNEISIMRRLFVKMNSMAA